jgi:hypothetical protein
MIQGTDKAFPISNLYKNNLANAQNSRNLAKSYKDECNPNLLNLKQCYDQNYNPDVHGEGIDGSETVTMGYKLLAECNWENYMKCKREDLERLNL